LVDIARCVSSGYEMLMDPPEGSGQMFARALRLDETGNTKVLDLARRTGRSGGCTTCTAELGSQVDGFRATVRGFLVPDSGVPQTLQVTEVLASSVGCGNDTFVPGNVTFEVGSGGGISPVSLHGGLMVTAWGFLLPTGVLSAVLLRHRPDGLWFQMHRSIQIIGFFLSIVGIIVAFRNFGNVFEREVGPSYRHAVIGLTTMICGFLQVLGGALRPHAPEEGEEKTTIRFVWEIMHKFMGYSAIILAYGTIYLGSVVAGIKRDAFFGVFIATLVYAGVVGCAFLVDKFTFKPPPADELKKGGMTKGEKMEPNV